MRFLVLVVAIAALVVHASAVARAAPPATSQPASQPATRPAGRTDHDQLAEIAEFDQKFVVDAYEQKGHRDPKWDAVAVKLVHSQYEASLANPAQGQYYAILRYVPAMAVADRAALARQVIDSGCDDAMVLFLAGNALKEAGDSLSAKAFALADEHAAGSPYLPIYKVLMFDAAMQSTQPLSEDDPELDQMRERFRAILRLVLADKETLPKYRAVIWAKGAFVFESNNHDAADRIATAMSNVKDPDPWLWGVFMGHAELERAWKSRGNGWANTVTEEGWAGFRKHLDFARQHLEQAAEIDKTLPHAPAMLIMVALGEGTPDAQHWFDEAKKRQIDYLPAYNNYRNIVQPRWSGSIEQQIALAKSEVATGRFDTRVPALASQIVDDMELDLSGPLTPELVEEMAPIIDEAMQGYATKSRDAWVRSWANSLRLAWMALTEDWANARQLLDEMPQVEDGPVENRDIDPRELIGKVLAMTHPQADAIAAAMEQSDSSVRAEKLQMVLDTMTDDESAATLVAARSKSARRWVERRLIEAKFDASLASGDWVPLPIEKDLEHWRSYRGEWKIDGENAIIGTSKAGLLTAAPFQLPGRCEMRCTVELIGEADATAKTITVFPAFSPRRKLGGKCLLPESRGYLTDGYYNYGNFPVALSGNSTALIFRCNDGAVSVLDETGRTLVTGTPPHGRSRRPAFGGLTEGEGVTWRFSDIAVRKLK